MEYTSKQMADSEAAQRERTARTLEVREKLISDRVPVTSQDIFLLFRIFAGERLSEEELTSLEALVEAHQYEAENPFGPR